MALPPRPYAIDPDFIAKQKRRIAILLALGALIFVACTAWQLRSLRSLRDDLALWNRGEVANDARVRGKVSSQAGFYNRYDLAVTYSDGKGVQHDGSLAFSLLAVEIPSGAPVTLKFDPQEPDRFALSWEADYAESRYRTIAFLFILGACLMGGGTLLAGMQRLSRLRLLRAVAAQSEEVALVLVRSRAVAIGSKPPSTIVHFRRGEKGRVESQTLLDGEQPMRVDGHLVALVSPQRPKELYLVREGLRPFVLS